MSMRIPRTQYEWDRPALGITEKEFDKGADLYEGINGSAHLDTKFENTERLQVMDPHGDHHGRPMPRDGDFFEADNHFEWGKDSFDKAEYDRRFEGRRRSGQPYDGLGLPKAVDYSPNANPAYGNCATMCEPESAPGDQGIGQKTP
jgi:hypothetical protein